MKMPRGIGSCCDYLKGISRLEEMPSRPMNHSGHAISGIQRRR